VSALKAFWQNRNQAIRNLSNDFSAVDPDTNAPLTFAGMLGMPQLLSNLTGDAIDGSVLAGQYTPIVVDLGDVGVMTSGVFGGTFFNMAAAYDPSIAREAAFDQPHATAWLGGGLVDAPTQSALVQYDFQRVAQDGFFVMTDSDGQVRSSRNLFGNETVVNGQTFTNGFLALQAPALTQMRL